MNPKNNIENKVEKVKANKKEQIANATRLATPRKYDSMVSSPFVGARKSFISGVGEGENAIEPKTFNRPRSAKKIERNPPAF